MKSPQRGFFIATEVMNVSLRKGVKGDLPRVLELIKELAVFEKAGDQVSNTVQQMEKDGFGETPVYGFFVLERESEIIGLSLYYFRYSTWKGRRLYLEDIIVTESARGGGFGKLLFERTMKFALESGCTGMMWQVLDWNEPAIRFYKKYNAKLDDEWLNGHLESSNIKAFFDSNN
ncbi:N-acetyltransferase [Cytophagales bacterium WSM2-2]|nr:N-acetyltransferase [Cytophagales bacterium WSM2-2]